MIMNHLANADVPCHNGNQAQLQAFRAACQAVFPSAWRSKLVGPHQSVDDVARLAGTIGYEILTGMGERLHCHYQYE